MLTSQGRGTKSHVLFLIRALNSDCIADFQLGSDKASLGFLGSGEMVGSSMVTERLKSFLGLWIPRMLRVAMVLVGGAGGAGGVGDGEVLGESIEVEEDVMVGEVLGVSAIEGDRWSGGGLGELAGRGCKVGLFHWWTICGCKSSVKHL